MLMRYSNFYGSRKAYVFCAYVVLTPLLIAALYLKFFPDVLVSDVEQNSVVVEVEKIEGSGVGANSSMVTVQLDSGKKSKFMMRMAPHVGQNIKVNVMTYENGDVNISPRREF